MTAISATSGPDGDLRMAKTLCAISDRYFLDFVNSRRLAAVMVY
jgi:hypothetical protein